VYISPFDAPGSFYKGNLHTHSNRSDGKLTPEEVVNAYRVRGYDFISLTDHFLPVSHFRKDEPGFISVTDTRPYDCDRFVTIPGAEIHGPLMENGELWHFVAVGLPLDFAELAASETGPEVARRAAEAGAFVALAHPYWNGVSEIDALSIADIVHGVEVYNHASEVGVKRGYGEHQAEVLLSKNHRKTFYAADDAHFKHPAGTFVDAFGGWVMVKAADRNPDAILGAIKAGAFYASCGPDFHNIEIDGDVIRVSCSPVEQVIVSGRGVCYQRSHGPSAVSFEAPLPTDGKTPYVRVTLVDAYGRMAWSNPIWLDTLDA
jgi:predicted metal-dependent phosphoesterase TrpH